MTSQTDVSLAGIWHSSYWYPSNTHAGEDVSEYYVQVHQRGNKLMIESLPNKEDSHISIHVTIDDDLATGTWQEGTSPQGEFKGAIYSGAVQLIIEKNHKRMVGRWVGVGQEDGQRQIYTGRWEMQRAGSGETTASHTA